MLTVVVSTHDPASVLMYAWCQMCENGTPGYQVTGTVTVSDVSDAAIGIYELENCICYGYEANDMSLDGGDVALETFQISYARARRIGP